MQANPKQDHPPFGEVSQIVCERCGHVDRKWWHAGDGPFEVIDPARHEAPVPDACPKCGGPLLESLILIDGGGSLRSLALAVMDFAAGVDDTREGVEFLRGAIDSGLLDDAETARAYQWIRFAGQPEDATVEPKDGDR